MTSIHINEFRESSEDEVLQYWAERESRALKDIKYERGHILKYLPLDIQWFNVTIQIEQIKRFYVINAIPWTILSEDTKLLRRTAENIVCGKFEQNTNPQIKSACEKIKGMMSTKFRVAEFKPILIAQSTDSKTVVDDPTLIDGNHSATVLYSHLFVNNIPSMIEGDVMTLDSFIGLSKTMASCRWMPNPT